MLHPAWCSSGFGIAVSSSVTVTHLLWSENLYITAKNIGEWQIMFTQLTNLLTSHGLQWKENSVIWLEGGIDYDESSWTLPEFPELMIHRKLELESIGTIIQHDGGDETSINRALRKTNAAFWAQSPVLLSKHLSWKTRFKRLTSFVLPVMMHAVSTWTWKKSLLDLSLLCDARLNPKP